MFIFVLVTPVLETVIDEEMEGIGTITKQELKNIMDVLDEYHTDQQKLNQLKGYYDIEHKLEALNITRWKTITILTYLKANGQYKHVIAKFNSGNSPTECKTFELDDWDR